VGDRLDLVVDRPGEGKITLSGQMRLQERVVFEGRMTEANVAYIRLRRFPDSTNQRFREEFRASLGSLLEADPAGWIIDLRNNGGGSRDTAQYVAAVFGARDMGAVVWSEGRLDVRAFSRDLSGGKPIVVLINPSTASAAELVAEVLRQEQGAKLVGEQTLGALAEAHSIQLRSGVLTVTTGRILVGPKQVEVDGRGVSPDFAVALDAVGLANGHDAQLEKAVSVLKELD
jgi:carboxyl-terminal processing protease